MNRQARGSVDDAKGKRDSMDGVGSPSMFGDQKSTVNLNESSVFQILDSKDQPIAVTKGTMAIQKVKG